MNASALSFGSTPIVMGIKSLYGVVAGIDDFVDSLIKRMKDATSPAIARTGRVLEGAKFGFGLGYIIPVAVIAAGQLLLGNTVAALTTLGTAAVVTNPVATTCAAIGAIYYGWQALSESERNDILEQLASGLSLGVELLRSLIDFVVRTTKELLSSENFLEVREFVSDAAASFGRTLSDITRTIKDRAVDAYEAVSESIETVTERVKKSVGRSVPKVTTIAEK